MIFDIDCLWRPFDALPYRLSTLHCRSIRDGSLIANLVKHNRASLRSLRLGDELQSFPRYDQSHHGYLHEHSKDLLARFENTVKIEDLPSLENLEINSIDVRCLAIDSDPLPRFHHIQRLVLESCVGSADFLASMASSFSSFGMTHPIKLKQFLFRHEAVSLELKNALLTFLDAFEGLETLSILWENTTVTETVPQFICKHGKTLRTLVLECRLSPRLTVRHDTSRPFGIGGYSNVLWESAIDDISRLCPNLIELGTSFPWDEDTVQVSYNRSLSYSHADTFRSCARTASTL